MADFPSSENEMPTSVRYGLNVAVSEIGSPRDSRVAASLVVDIVPVVDTHTLSSTKARFTDVPATGSQAVSSPTRRSAIVSCKG